MYAFQVKFTSTQNQISAEFPTTQKTHS